MKKILFRLLRLHMVKRLRQSGWTWNKINTLLYALDQDVIYETKISTKTGEEIYIFGPYIPRGKKHS